MKKIILLSASVIALASCSNPLDKPFDRETAEADFARIVKLKKIDSLEAYKMSHFMVEHELIGAQVLELNATYRDILEESKKFWETSHGGKEDAASSEPKGNEQLTKDLKVSIVPLADGVLQSEWSHGLKYHVVIENTSGKAIKAIKGSFVLYDAFGDKINAIEYKYLDGLAAGEKVERDVTLRLQNVVTPQLILEYGKTNPFEVKWEPLSLIF